MKFCKRYLSLFLCLPLLFGLFSTPVSAEAVDTSTLKVNILGYGVNYKNGSNYNFGQVNINNGASADEVFQITTPFKWEDKVYQYRAKMTFVDSTGAILFKAGEDYTFEASNLLFYHEAQLTNGSWLLDGAPEGIASAFITYADGTEEVFTDYELVYNASNTYFNIKANISPDKDVYKIGFRVAQTFDAGTEFSAYGSSSSIGQTGGDALRIGVETSLKIDITKQSEEAGLLSGIINWVKTIANDVSAGFANMVKGITELPDKLWSLIENGLKSLFVPDQEYMASYSDKWDELLSSRLGAVYECGALVIECWQEMLVFDQTNTIEFPVVGLDFGNTNFQFGPYTVEIVPEPFIGIADIFKVLVGIICTLAFINGMVKRYEEVMGVEQ